MDHLTSNSDKPDREGTRNSVPYPAIEDKEKRIIRLISGHKVIMDLIFQSNKKNRFCHNILIS